MAKYKYDYRKIVGKELYEYINENSTCQRLVMYDKPANDKLSISYLKR